MTIISQLYQNICYLLNWKNFTYIAFLNTTDHKHGFPKFCQLCPKWCITVDNTSGVHSVCVCKIHQHAKLLHAAIPGKIDYKEFLSKFVCHTSNQDCMLHSCDKLLKLKWGRKVLNLFEESNFGTEDSVNFKQCTQKERGISLIIVIVLQHKILCKGITGITTRLLSIHLYSTTEMRKIKNWKWLIIVCFLTA